MTLPVALLAKLPWPCPPECPQGQHVPYQVHTLARRDDPDRWDDGPLPVVLLGCFVCHRLLHVDPEQF